MANSGASIPFYKKNHPMEKYKILGDPLVFHEDDLPLLEDWVPISKEKREMWMDSKSVVQQKNKKREYYVKYSDKAEKTDDGMLRMRIEMLHVDRRGFKYTAEANDITTLNRNFWPNVEWLIAHCFAPRFRRPAPPILFPDQKDGQEEHHRVAMT